MARDEDILYRILSDPVDWQTSTAERNRSSREQLELSGYSASVWAGMYQPHRLTKKRAYSTSCQDPDSRARDLASRSWAPLSLSPKSESEIGIVI